MQEHRSQEEEEAVNALVDAVNQHDISREDQQQSHQSSNRVSAQQSDDNGMHTHTITETFIDLMVETENH